MIKSIIVAVDESNASVAAQDFAVRIAAMRQASLTGMGIVDRPWITHGTATPIGGGAFKQHRDEVLLDKNRVAVQQRLAEFKERCASAGVTGVALGVEGVPHEQISREACRHDLIVIGRDTDFHDTEHPDIAETVTQLLRKNPRPVLVVPADAKPVDKVVVAFDGGLQASRAAHLFLLLGLAQGEVHVVHVASDRVAANAEAERATALFQAHGVEAVPQAIVSSRHPADALVEAVSGMNAGMLVMGAFSSHGLVHRIFVGSATRRLLEACPIPLFVYH